MEQNVISRALRLNKLGYRLMPGTKAMFSKPRTYEASDICDGLYYTTVYPYDETIVVDEHGREKYSYLNNWKGAEA